MAKSSKDVSSVHFRPPLFISLSKIKHRNFLTLSSHLFLSNFFFFYENLLEKFSISLYMYHLLLTNFDLCNSKFSNFVFPSFSSFLIFLLMKICWKNFQFHYIYIIFLLIFDLCVHEIDNFFYHGH